MCPFADKECADYEFGRGNVLSGKDSGEVPAGLQLVGGNGGAFKFV